MNMRSCFLLMILTTLVTVAQAQKPVLTSRGLSADTTYFLIDDARVNNQELAIGTPVEFIFSGMHGFSIRDGKSFPGIEMMVLDQKRNVVLQYADLLDQYPDGVKVEDVRTLTMSLLVGSPLKEDEAYTWYGRVWDKNGKSELIAEIPIRVVAGKDVLGIKTVSQGLTCKNSYLFNKQVLKSNVLRRGDKVTFLFSGVNGFTPDDKNLVKIGMHVKLTDADGVNLIEYTDLFRDYGPVDATKATTLTTYMIIEDPIAPGKSYTWWVKVWDKGTNKSFESSVVVKVE